VEEIRLVRWNDCVAGAGILGFQTPLAKILVRQLAPNHAKQKTKSKTYRYGCKRIAPNGIYDRILSPLVLITRQVRNAVPKVAEVILHHSPVRGRMLFRSGSAGIHRLLLILLGLGLALKVTSDRP
jgi:hypothetical protein